MGRREAVRLKSAEGKDFLELLRSLCSSKEAWQVWSDCMRIFAISIANSLDSSETAKKREEEYRRIMSGYKAAEQEVFPKLLALIVSALERNPDQDFLGELFQALSLNDHWKGQFFTPYGMARLLAETTQGNCADQLREREYLSVCDPACGAGVTLIVVRNHLMREGLDWSTKALFAAQDIDRTAALMCFIQLSLLGCAGYVVVGNSITHPMVGDPILPIETEGQEYWFTPAFYLPVWRERATLRRMQLLVSCAEDQGEKKIA